MFKRSVKYIKILVCSTADWFPIVFFIKFNVSMQNMYFYNMLLIKFFYTQFQIGGKCVSGVWVNERSVGGV